MHETDDEAMATNTVGANLAVKDLMLTMTRGATVIVDEISFDVNAGEILALVGESGSGKTSIALALMGHCRRGLKHANGSVEVGGQDVFKVSESVLESLRGAQVAYVPQDPGSALNPAHKIKHQLEESLSAHPEFDVDRAERVAEVVREVGLADIPQLLDRYPHQLSGGQQQRVALAMAFACRPRVLVLDEPTTGLDVTTQRHVLETVRDLCARYGVAAVYVSHDLAVVSELASHVAIVYSGRIVEHGAAVDVLCAPRHPYTRGLLASVPLPDSDDVVHGIDGRPPRPGGRPRGCAFAPRCEFRSAVCLSEPPAPQPLPDGRLVRCVRIHEISPGEVERRRPMTRPVRSSVDARLSVRELTASYGSRKVLNEINFDLVEGACVALVGESGAGKTTLAQSVAGLHTDWTGEVLLGGEALPASARKRPREALRRIQYVFQNPYLSLNPRKTIEQILREPVRQFGIASSSKDAKSRVVAAVESVSLGADYLPRYPDELSGGERQRVALARALIVEPEVLICDEVTSALDVSVQAAVVELLLQLRAERNLAMVFVTHNLGLVRSIADDCLVLWHGEAVECGPVAGVLDDPGHSYTKALMADIPVMMERAAG